MHRSFSIHGMRPAIVYGSKTLTYGELGQKSDMVAAGLRLMGAGKDSAVGVLLENRMDLIIVLVGILKAGAAFMPLDPDYPAKRLQAMITAVDVKIVVTDEANLGKLAEIKSAGHSNLTPVFAADLFREPWDETAAPPSGIDYGPDDMIYIYFTSGTSGKPKAIAGRNKGLWHFVNWEIETFNIHEDFRVSQFTSPCHDPFLRDVITPLCAGGTVYIPESKLLILEPASIIRWIEETRVDLIHCTPSLFRVLNSPSLTAANFSHLKYVLLAGERVIPQELTRWFRIFGERIQLVNLYGPTETTLAKLFYFIRPSDTGLKNMPIGKPMKGAAVILLNQNRQICKPGEAGEIVIRTPYRTLGYYADPEATAGRFIPNPFQQDPEDLIYLTGDLGRMLPDGNIEFMGRLDRQVKIRGFRVELSEIENALIGHAGVRECVVDYKQEPLETGGVEFREYLAAYLVTGREIDPAELRTYLEARLPDYMIPAFFINMPRIPLTPNGKVDYQALPEPKTVAQTDYIPLQNEIETKLAEIWSEILGVTGVGRNDNFLKIGGHSLKLMSLISRVYQEFEIELPLGEVFNHPTIGSIAELIAGMGKTGYLPLVPVAEREYYPVSSGQKRLFMLDQLGGAGTSYNIPGVALLEGKLERNRLEQAFQRLIRRHEPFRTSFAMIEGNPVQRIHPEAGFAMEYTELAGSEDPAELRRITGAFIRPFDLQTAPLIRVVLLKIKENRHLLMFDMHHIISDGSSMGILVGELFDYYEGREPAPLPIQYKDYAVWQNQIRETGTIKPQEEYWLKQFAGEVPVLNLLTDYPRTNERSFAGDNIRFRAGEKILAGLNTISRETGATLYMALLAAYYTLLYKYTDQTDIVVGSIISGRNRAEIERLIGMFVNTLPLRNFPEGAKTYREFLNEVKENALEAFRNQDYQFEELVNRLDLARDLGRNPLFDTVFVFQNTGMPGLNIADLTISPYTFESKSTKFDITIHIFEGETGLDFNLEYCTRLFKRETVERLAGHYLNILGQVCAAADRKLAEIDILTEAERQWVMADYNGTMAEFPGPKTMVGLFEQQAERTPDDCAIRFETQQLSYGELDRKSNQVAHFLLEQGVQPGHMIGVLVKRCPETVANLLGVLKAGAAYVPVEPDYPPERKEYILRHSDCRMLLLPEIYSVKELAAYPNGKLRDNARPESIAYIIYTSGSTGNPKGVVITHQAAVNTLVDINRKFEVTPADRHLGLSSLCFDLSVYDVFGAFAAGSTLVQIPDQRDVKNLIRTVTEQRITIWNSVPAIMEMMVDNLAAGFRNESLRLVMLSGDWIPLSLPVKIKKHFPNAAVISLGGATEASIWSIYYPIAGIQSEWRSIPYGKPLANQQMYVLNGDGQICPVGIRGELHIGGLGLAEGYYNDPDKTGAAFIRHPALGGLYRTGDYGVFREEEYIEFLGRKDSQVKIRGYRIELGEIEARLLEHPRVKEAVVVVRGNESGNKYVCAYLTAAGDLIAAELKSYLADRLPEYMIPAFLVMLEALPLTPNGKIDRKGLPEPVAGENTKTGYEAPRNTMEEDLAEIWREILGLDQIGIHDDFFDLGGHSLKAATLVARLHQKFNVELPLREVFKTPTIDQLARFIGEAGINIHQSIPPAAERDFYPLSPAQKRLYFLYRFDESQTSYNMPGVIWIEGDLDPVKLENAVKQVIERHEILRTSFLLAGGDPVQQVHREVNFAMAYRKLDGAPASGTDMEAHIRRILPGMVQEFVAPFHLNQAPLLRILLVKLNNEKFVLMFDMHHIISDAVSMEIIIHEIMGLYSGAVLPELKIQYKDYAVWQNESLVQEKLRKQEEYWLERFRGEIPVLQLNTDYPRPLIQSFEGAKWNFSAGRDLAAALARLSAETGATIYMILLGALTIMLSKYTGQEDIVIGSPMAGRTHTDLENLIGMFINMLPMRNLPQSGLTCTGFLAGVKENALAAYENQDYQFEHLLDRLNIKRDLGRNPLFDVVFVLQNAGRAKSSETGLKITPYEFEQGISKFDLTLSAVEHEGDIRFYFEYCTKLFAQGTIEQMAGHLLNILRQMADNPGETLSNLDMLSGMEKREILVDFQQPRATYPNDKVIQQLFEASAEKYPARVAVCCQDLKLTYLELNQKANRLARVLREKGVRPNSMVGVILDRSLEMVITILGILKAGGAYLPISPEYPADRISFMIGDSGLKVLVTQIDHLKNISPDPANSIEVIDIQYVCLDQGEASNLAIINQPEDLAYIIYTSGTTGRPKGSLIEHRNVVQLLCNDQFQFDFSENDVWTMFHSYCFDFSVWEMYGALLYGGRLVIIPAGTAKDAGKYLETLKTEKVTVVNQTPTAFYNLAAESLRRPGDELAGIRYIIFGGEALQPLKLKEWHEKYPKTKLINMYGITETTVHVTYKEITAKEIAAGISNIGKPLPTLTAYILDRHLKLLPVGAAGELCVGGAGVGRGYLGRPELTAARFIQSPFETGERLYRSGDLAKFLPNGEIEYLGRIDNQVKIRGFRIEISEIETGLLKHGSIREVTVVSKEDGTGNKYLCAYYTASQRLTVAELRGYLAQKLPDYMIPSFFIQLEAIPLTVNGKINKAALPEPVDMVLHTGEYQAPESTVEKELVGIWQKVLQIEHISVNDNFFEIGGDSIRLMKVYAELRNRYEGKVTMVDLFTYSTVKKLAEYLSKTQDNRPDKLISLPTLPIPADYFNDGRDYGSGEGFQLMIQGTVLAAIREFSMTQAVEEVEVLLAVYIYLLAQVSERHQVTVQIIIDEPDTAGSIAVDLNSVNDFRDLVKLVGRKRKTALAEMDFKTVYKTGDIKDLQEKVDRQGVLPCFCKTEFLTTRIGLKNFYDILLEMEETGDEIRINCHYNENRLKKEKIKEFAGNYLKLAKLLINPD